MACEVIRDLLVLYEDESCSEKSRKLVEEHLSVCPACRGYLEEIRRTDTLFVSSPADRADEETRVLKRCFRKIRRYWALSLLAILMLFPAMGIGLLGYHEYIQQGLAFSNLDAVYRCVHFVKCIERKHYEQAAACIDFSKIEYQNVPEAKDLGEEQFVAYMREKVTKRLEEYGRFGLSIHHVDFKNVDWIEGGWAVDVTFTESYPDGSSQDAAVSFDGESLLMVSHTAVPGWLGNILYIQELLAMHVADDQMGYRGYAAGFSLEKGEKAVITWKGTDQDKQNLRQIMLVNTTFGAAGSVAQNRFVSGKPLTLSVPGDYALLGEQNGQFTDLTELVDIAISETSFPTSGKPKCNT